MKFKFYNSIIQMRENRDNIEDLEIYFSINVEQEKNIVTEDLTPNGSSILVTSSNFEEYISK
jgi:hypothetical protein